MLNLMDDPPKWGRTLRTYLILIGCATNRQTITHGALGDRTNEFALNVSSRHLDPIYNYCEANGLPRLAVLAVNRTGVPGPRYPGPRETIYEDRAAVYLYNWFNIAPPTIAQLRGCVTNSLVYAVAPESPWTQCLLP